MSKNKQWLFGILWIVFLSFPLYFSYSDLYIVWFRKNPISFVREILIVYLFYTIGYTFFIAFQNIHFIMKFWLIVLFNIVINIFIQRKLNHQIIIDLNVMHCLLFSIFGVLCVFITNKKLKVKKKDSLVSMLKYIFIIGILSLCFAGAISV